MKFLKWLWKYLFIIIIATVVTIFMGYLAIRWIRYNDTYLYRYLFQDSNGKFAWTGFTAIIAIITLAINAWDNRRKFRADLISKSRITWMTDTRRILSEYYQVFSEYAYVYSKFTTEKRPEESNKLNSQMTELMGKIRRIYYEILLNIPDNESNEPLLKYVKLIFGELNNIVKYYEYGQSKSFELESHYYTVVDEYISNLINTGVKESSVYFKKEWERAKKGE